MYSPSRTIRRFVALALCNRCSRRFTFSLPPPFQINPSFPTSWSVKFRLTIDRDQHSLLFAFCFVFLSLTSAILCHYIFWSIRAYTQRTLRQSKSFNLLGRRVFCLLLSLMLAEGCVRFVDLMPYNCLPNCDVVWCCTSHVGSWLPIIFSFRCNENFVTARFGCYVIAEYNLSCNPLNLICSYSVMNSFRNLRCRIQKLVEMGGIDPVPFCVCRAMSNFI